MRNTMTPGTCPKRSWRGGERSIRSRDSSGNCLKLVPCHRRNAISFYSGFALKSSGQRIWPRGARSRLVSGPRAVFIMNRPREESEEQIRTPASGGEIMTKRRNSASAVLNGRAVPMPEIETHRRMLYYMKLTRELEDRIERKLYRQGKIHGGVYVGRGQEAIGVGSCIHSRRDDVICPSHRDMGAFLIRGMTPARILAQYMGRVDGYTRGKDGNMHMGDLSLNVISFVSMLADNVPVAAGVVLSFKIRKQDRVVLCYFGDGATSRGDWHEGLNFASVQKLPVVFICNNNQYAYSTPIELQMAGENVADRAPAYGMPGGVVDGNDILAAYGATRRALAQ